MQCGVRLGFKLAVGDHVGDVILDRARQRLRLRSLECSLPVTRRVLFDCSTDARHGGTQWRISSPQLSFGELRGRAMIMFMIVLMNVPVGMIIAVGCSVSIVMVHDVRHATVLRCRNRFACMFARLLTGRQRQGQ